MTALNFGKSRIVKGHGLSLGARLQAARGIPQAVVKVLSYSHGTPGVKASMKYISKDGELPLETESGDVVIGCVEQKELVKNWSRDFGNRKNSRDSVHLTFSMPKGSDPEALRGAVRTVLSKSFPGHESVFAIHQDRPHPHAHVVVKMRSRESGKQLRINRPEIQQLREAFAEAATEQGVELAASPRAARGVGEKGTSQAVHHLRKRGIVPRVDKVMAQEVMDDLERGGWREKVWEQAQRERNEQERKTYLKEAQRVRAEAALKKPAHDPKTQQALLKAAADLARYSEEMPEPKTRRQTMMEKFAKQFGIRNPQETQRESRDMGMER